MKIWIILNLDNFQLFKIHALILARQCKTKKWYINCLNIFWAFLLYCKCSLIYGIIQYWCNGRGEFGEGTGCLHPLMELHIWFAIDFFHVILHKLCLYWGPMLPLFQILNLQLTWTHVLLLSWYYRAMYVFINDFLNLSLFYWSTHGWERKSKSEEENNIHICTSQDSHQWLPSVLSCIFFCHLGIFNFVVVETNHNFLDDLVFHILYRLWSFMLASRYGLVL